MTQQAGIIKQIKPATMQVIEEWRRWLSFACERETAGIEDLRSI